MAEHFHENESPTTTAAAANRAPLKSHPATTLVETAMSRGDRTPRMIAAIMEAYPDARDEILAILHALAGNAFVQEVATTKPAEEPTAADVPLGQVRITASSLRVRSSPSAAGKNNVVGRLTRGAVVTAEAKQGDWLRIEHAGQTCFIHGDYCASVIAPPKKLDKQPSGEEDDGGGATQETAPPVVEAKPEPKPAEAKPEPRPAEAKPEPVIATPAPIADARQGAAPEIKPEAAPPVVINATAALGGTYKGVFDKIYSTGSQVSQVWVSAGGVTSSPNIYLHFHGHRTDYGIDDDLDWHEGGKKENKKTGAMEQVAPKSHRSSVDRGGSGHRAAKEAMAAAQGQNTIAILPQGVLGESGGGANEGGYMKDLETLGLQGFLDKILKPLAKDLGVAGLTPGHIALGGHSAGGYEGIHSAMRRLDDGEKDAALMDTITDVTLFDASYGSGNHLDETLTWALHAGKAGTPTKNVRLVNGWGQQTEKAGLRKAHDLWYARFGEENLVKAAKKHGMTIRPVSGVGEQLDKETRVMQHTQIVRADGGIQADVLVVMYSQKGGGDHEPLRDRMIDDAIMSIGDGAAGNATFGRHAKGHLIDKAAALQQEEAKDDDHDHDDHHADAAQVVPQPTHVESDERDKPEKVVAAPAVADPPKKAKKAAKRDEEREKLFDELYNEKTGRVRASKLHQSVKRGKKTYEITDDEYKFKQLCYKLATERMTGRLYGGCDEHELEKAPGSHEKVRKEVIPDLTSFISAAEAAGHKIRVTSGYRPPEEDMGIWDSAFNRMYLPETKAQREKRWPDEPLGEKAARYLVEQIAGRKAPPGKSNHSNGIAVDFTATVNGKDVPNIYTDQSQWRKSEVFQWLKDNDQKFNFKNLSTEAWHYDWKP